MKTSSLPELLEAFASAANKIDIDSSLSRKDWKQMADALRDSAELNPDHLTKIRRFAKDVRSYHNQLTSRLPRLGLYR